MSQFYQDLADITLRRRKVKPLDSSSRLGMDAMDQEYNMTSSSVVVKAKDLPFDTLVQNLHKTMKHHMMCGRSWVLEVENPLSHPHSTHHLSRHATHVSTSLYIIFWHAHVQVRLIQDKGMRPCTHQFTIHGQRRQQSSHCHQHG